MIKGKGFTVKTGSGHLLVTEVQPPDKRPMTAMDVMNGKLIKKGSAFLSDPAFLEALTALLEEEALQLGDRCAAELFGAHRGAA